MTDTEELTPEQQHEQEQAAFNSAFEDPKPEVKAPDKQVEVTTEKADATAPEPEDPWKNVNPVIKQQLDEIKQQNTKLESDVKAAIGRAAAVQAAFDAAKKAATAAGTQAPTQNQISQAASSEKWKKLKEDFPDWAEALDERLAEQAANNKPQTVDQEALKKGVFDSLTPTLQQIRAELRAEASREVRELAKIDAKHEGWEDTVKNPAFNTWMESQTAEVKALASSDKSADAIRMLDLYATHLKAVEKQKAKQERLGAALTPQGTGMAGGPELLSDREQAEQAFNEVFKS
jgi:hypothetical protein